MGCLGDADICFPIWKTTSTGCEGEPLTVNPLGLRSSDLRNRDSGLKGAQRIGSSLSRRALSFPDRASNLLRIPVTLPAWRLLPKMKPPASPIASLPCHFPSPIGSLSPFSRKSIHHSNLSALPSASYPLSHGSHGNRRGWPGRQGCLATRSFRPLSLGDRWLCQ